MVPVVTPPAEQIRAEVRRMWHERDPEAAELTRLVEEAVVETLAEGTRVEHQAVSGVRHVSDVISRAGGVAICGRWIGDLGPVETEGPLCMNCRDALRRLDPTTDDYRTPSAGAPGQPRPRVVLSEQDDTRSE